MYLGWHDLCLACKDIDASTAFYSALGMDVTRRQAGWVHLTTGDLHISLMGFLQHNMINFRGADVAAIHATATAGGLSLPGVPEAYSKEQMGCDGVHWRTSDPDGNVVYLDTTADEVPKSRLVERLLEDVETSLAKAGIESEAFAAFKAELTQRYLAERAES